MKIGFVLLAGAMMFGVMFLTGCAGETGWRVSFGVAPVTTISDRAELRPGQLVDDEQENGGHYARRK